MPEGVEEIATAIHYMRKRLESGQGNKTSAMCRLSLRMSEQLLGYARELERQIIDNYVCADEDAWDAFDEAWNRVGHKLTGEPHGE